MKLGAIINIFDGAEFLETSVTNLRESCQNITVVTQTLDNWRETEHHDGHLEALRLQKLGLIDDVIHYNPAPVAAATNEINKRRVGFRHIVAKKCTHYIHLDSDEIYEKQAFKRGVDYVRNNRIDYSIVCGKNYLRKPDLTIGFLNEPLDTRIAFICRANPNLGFGGYNKRPPVLDPTRTPNIPPVRFKQVPIEVCFCHHYYMVRKDIQLKMNVSTFKGVAKWVLDTMLDDYYNIELGQPLKSCGNRTLQQDVDLFNLNSKFV